MLTDQKRALATLIGLALIITSGLACEEKRTPIDPSPQPQPVPAAAPAVAAIAPSTGTTAGGVNVTITGTGFVNGASVSIGGEPAASIAVAGATSITATTPAHAAGESDVVVTNPDGLSGRLAAGFTYTEPPPPPVVIPPPSIASISPSTGSTAGGTLVTIAGAGFAAGATVSFGGTTAAGVTVLAATSITATTPSRSAGAVDVAVSNPDGQTGRQSGAFTYVEPPPPPPPAPVAPTVTAISPAVGTTSGGTAVTITGTGFLSGATLSIGGPAATNVVVTSSTTIAAVTPARSPGGADVVVTNTDGQIGRLALGYTYQLPAPSPPPAIAVITITPNGMSPPQVTVGLDQRVRFVNNDVVTHTINSDPHPAHGRCPQIDAIGFLVPGQSRDTDVFDILDTCGFHDHNDPDNPKWKGAILIR